MLFSILCIYLKLERVYSKLDIENTYALFGLPGLLHLDLHSHPRMDTALKIVLTFRQARDLNMTALNDPGLGNINVFKTTSAFGSGFLTCVEGVDKAPAELLHFSKGVRLAALVNDRNNGPFFDFA